MRRIDLSAEKVLEYLLKRGIRYEVEEHRLAFTTAQVAEAEHVSVKEMAKPVIIVADGQLVMAVVPGHKRVDPTKVQAVLGCDEVRTATEDEFAPAFGDCETGAEPPLGSMYGMRTVVDQGFVSEKVTFRGGSHTQTITMSRDDYLRLSGAELVEIAGET